MTVKAGKIDRYKRFKFAILATDVVIFTVQDNQLKVLLMKMNRVPYSGFWAVPGGLVKPDESLDEAAVRHLESKTGFKDVYLEQLFAFGKVDRDPFGRVVSVAYLALVAGNGLGEGLSWFSIGSLPRLAYDHENMIKTAVNRLRAKLSYTNIVYGLLPKEFTQTELQDIYEIILGHKLDKRNFRRKVLSLGLIEQTGQKRRGAAHRPAQLWRFKDRKLKIVEVL